MFKAQYKSHNASQVWQTIGSYSSESAALNMAMRKKSSGALMVRVIDKNGNVVYSG